MFSRVAPLRPYLLAATALVLGYAFYQAYKPVKKDDCGCAEKKPFMQSKTFLWAVTLLSVGLSAFPYYAPYFQKDTPKQTAIKGSGFPQTVLHIEGMSCAACEGYVNHALQKKKGVKEVTTSYGKRQTIVRFDSSQISIRQLAATIENETGYKVTNLKRHAN